MFVSNTRSNNEKFNFERLVDRHAADTKILLNLIRNSLTVL